MSDLNFQVRAPLKLELVSGDVVTVENWSLKGIEFPGDAEVLPQKAQLSIPFQGVDIQFPVGFKPADEEGWLQFDGLTGRQRETLAVFYRSILSGKMASTEEVITSLDTPVDLVPMGETEEEEEQGKAKQPPRLLRVIWNITFYAVLAVTVFGLVGGQIWNAITRVGVAQARIEAPYLDHIVAEGAYVERVLVEEGDRVKQGAKLVILSSPDNTGEVTEIRREVRRAEDIVARAQERLDRHLAGLDAERERLLRRFLEAIAARAIEDFVHDTRLEEVHAAWAALHAFDAGLSVLPDDFHDIRLQLVDALSAEELILGRRKRRLSAAKSEGGAADIVAAEDGIVRDIAVFRDQFVARGTLAVTIEERSPRLAVGWLNEGMSAAVYQGMDASVKVNVGGQTQQFPGKVVNIEAGVDPDRPGVFGLRISVLPNIPEDLDRHVLLRPGAPIEMQLKRGWAYLPDWAGN